MAALTTTHGVSPHDPGIRLSVGRSRRWRLARRLAKTAALLLASVAVLYLAGANIFLRTSLLRDVIGADPDSLLVDYTSAYTLWPGRVHAEGVSIRGRDTHVEWILRIDRCDFRVSLADLAYRKFHADHVRTDGVSMRLRRREDHFTAETMSALPPVPGFLDPPLADVGPPAPPPSDAAYHLWSVELDDAIAGHVHEVWIDTVRYSGDLDVHARWLFRPLRSLDVGPAAVDVRSLDASFGMVEPWASDVAGRLELRIYPFNIESVPAPEVLDRISIQGELSGKAWMAKMANRILDGRAEALRGEAHFQVHAEIDHGVLRPGTHVRTEPFEVRANAVGLQLDASLQGDLQVDENNVAYEDVRVIDLRAAAGGQERARAASVAATFTSRHLDLAESPFSDPAYAVEVDRAASDSLAYWSSRANLPHDVQVVSGSVTFGGRVEGGLRTRTGKGLVDFGLRSLAAEGGGARMQSDGSGVVHFDGSLEGERVDLSRSAISLRDVRATMKGLSVEAPTLGARAEGLVAGKPGLAGRILVDAPVLRLPSLAALSALVTLPKDIAIEGGRGTARVHMDLDVAQLAGNGEASFAARDLRVRLGAQRLEGDLTVALRAKQHGAVTDLSSSQVEFKSLGAAGALDWWGRVQMRQATLGVRPGLRFRTHVSAAAKDGSPLTALVADNTALPAWLIDVVSTRSLEATGEVLVTQSLFAVRSVEAHVQGADADFEFGKIRKDKKEWALLLDLGAALVGVDVADGKTEVLLFGARPWFQSKVASLEAVERRSE